MSQSDLAIAAQVKDPQQISKWERAIYKPADETLFALAEALGRDLAWFYTDHEPEEVAA